MRVDINNYEKVAETDIIKWTLSIVQEPESSQPHIDLSKSIATPKVLPICFDTIEQAIRFSLDSSVLSPSIAKPLTLHVGQRYIDASNIIASGINVQWNDKEEIDTYAQFYLAEEVLEKGFESIKETLGGFKTLGEEEHSLWIQIVPSSDHQTKFDSALEAYDAMKHIRIRTYGMEEYGLKDLSTNITVPTMVSEVVLLQAAAMFIDGFVEQDMVVGFGTMIISAPEEDSIPVKIVSCKMEDDLIFLDLYESCKMEDDSMFLDLHEGSDQHHIPQFVDIV